MAPPRSSQSRPPGLVRQLSLQQTPPAPPPGATSAPSRRGLLRRQRSAEDDRPVTRLLHSALRVSASALGPGFLVDSSPPPPPAPPSKLGKLRPVRVAWAELRKSSNTESSEAVTVIAQRVDLTKPTNNHNAKPPHCLPALARANLKIFLAHSGLAQCITSTVLAADPPAPLKLESPATPATLSPREVIKPSSLSPLPSRPALPPPQVQLTASARRVNFRNSTFRTINRSLSDSSTPEPRPPVEQRTGRVLSAPAHRPTPSVAPPRPMLRSLPRRSPLQGSFDKGDCGSEQLTVPVERNIRSAPTRRRFKVGSAANSAARKKGGGRRGEESSGDEEIEEQPSAPPRVGSAGARGRRGLRVGAEIVTMVSLVSPAGSSDSEDDRSPRLSTSPIPALPTPAWQPAEDKPFVLATPTSAQVIVCARKITKSVSFQTRGVVPGLVRRTSSQFTLAAVPVSAPQTAPQPASEPSSPKEPPSPQESQPTPPQQDCRIKKKLSRTKAVLRHDSEIAKTCVSPAEVKSAAPVPPITASGFLSMVCPPTRAPSPSPRRPPAAPAPQPTPGQEEEDNATPRPHFESPKEKECWQLYRKMCEKGLTVSFDTVLRGMLTPTEYRLRRGALLSSC